MSEQEMTIKEAAEKLGRLYEWVHNHLKMIGADGCRREKGRILINSLGFERMTKLSVEAPGRGRPGRKKRAAMCADWCAEHGMGAPKQGP